MTPDQTALIDAMLSAAADDQNTVDMEDIAQSAFALLVWSLSNVPPARRDFLTELFTDQLAVRLAVLLDDSEGRIEFARIQ